MVELLHVQVASALSLAGMALGWRGGMRELHGFYDAPKAVSALLWGIGLGALAAAGFDIFVFEPYFLLVYQGGSPMSWATLVTAIIISAGITSLTLWKSANRKVRATFASPVTGWAFGLGTGAMLSMRLSYRVLEIEGGFTVLGMVQMGILSLVTPLIHAVIGCGLGSRAQRGEVKLSIFWAIMSHLLAVILLTYSVIQIVGWVLIVPLLLLGMQRANSKWLPESLHPEAARRLRRVRADAARKARAQAVSGGTLDAESE